MKKVFAYIGAAIYGLFASVLLWLAFHLATPWLMSFGWLAVVIYVIFLLGLIPTVFGFIGHIITMPIIPLLKICPSAKYIPIWCMIVEGFCAAREPWILDIDYELVKIIIACSITAAAITTFAGIAFAFSAYLKTE